MREWQKRELIDCIKSLEQAHEEIKETLSSHNYNLAQNMISECQEFAITLGNTIENLNGKDHITISYVQQYCELVYEIFQTLANTQVNENKGKEKRNSPTIIKDHPPPGMGGKCGGAQ